jgi:hypothetical protein
MQVMPPTAKQLDVGDITKVEANIHAGVKHTRFMMDQYLQDDPVGRSQQGVDDLCGLQRRAGTREKAAARDRKAGPSPQRRVRQRRACRLGADRPRNGDHVANIYKYCITYRLLADQQARRDAAKAQVGKGK